jgi:hypothetical protein
VPLHGHSGRYVDDGNGRFGNPRLMGPIPPAWHPLATGPAVAGNLPTVLTPSGRASQPVGFTI